MIIELLWIVAFSIMLAYVIQNKNWVMACIIVIMLAVSVIRINEAFEDRRKALVFMRDILRQESGQTKAGAFKDE